MKKLLMSAAAVVLALGAASASANAAAAVKACWVYMSARSRTSAGPTSITRASKR